ncbi:hypothetical protein TSOC_001480 [Tetrabaena socialis]|uniref:Uncharacterized protein n=1 Tax=Tetrabaena socialis TaxID=47790 RepID=A0A2J8AGQ9_9CHLO|nr:hypothetical protein TSOC_001480 [Tetrabaena socialis]|eukprot:PNH11704.1 hypothetical protein TSOC_001480 [Tetrabaena socialis]
MSARGTFLLTTLLLSLYGCPPVIAAGLVVLTGSTGAKTVGLGSTAGLGGDGLLPLPEPAAAASGRAVHMTGADGRRYVCALPGAAAAATRAVGTAEVGWL